MATAAAAAPTPSKAPTTTRAKRGVDKEHSPFVCAACGTGYSRAEYLRRHERSVHQQEAGKTFSCPDCNKSFARSDVLSRHRRRCHPEPGSSTDPLSNNSSSTSSAPVPAPSASSSIPAARPSSNSASPPPAPKKQRRRSSRPSPTSGSSNDNGPLGLPSLDEPLPPGGLPPGVLPKSAINSFTAQAWASSAEPRLPAPQLPKFPQPNGTTVSPMAAPPPATSTSPPPAAPAPAPPTGLAAPSTFPDLASYLGPTSSALRSTAPPAPHFPPALAPPVPTTSAAASASHLSRPLAAPHIPNTTFPSTSATFPAPTSAAPAPAPNFPALDPVPSPSAIPSISIPGMADSIWPALDRPVGLFEQLGNVFPTSPLYGIMPSAAHPHPYSHEHGILGTSAPPPHVSRQGQAPTGSPPTDQQNPFGEVDAESGEMSGVVDWLSLSDNMKSIVSPPIFNPDFGPEAVLLRVDASHKDARLGRTNAFAQSDKFYLPPDRFAGPYSIQHWGLPQLEVLSRLAQNTLSTSNFHLPLIHAPTFTLREAPVCLAFAICTTGGGSNATMRAIGRARSAGQQSIIDKPGRSAAEDAGLVKDVVRLEKLTMIHGSLSYKSRRTSQADMISLLQSLIIYYSPGIIDESCPEAWNVMPGGFPFAVETCRNAGLLSPQAEWAAIEYPSSPGCLQAEDERALEKRWKTWIVNEGRRRTVWIMFILDLLASIDMGMKPSMTAEEVEHLPLPAPEEIWNEPTPAVWAARMESFRPITFSEALLKSLYGCGGASAPPLNESISCILERHEMGPFARNVIVVTLLRGVLALGEPGGGIVGCRWAGGSVDDEAGLVMAYRRALERWRKGWDFDRTCHEPAFSHRGSSSRASFASTRTSHSSSNGSDSSPSDYAPTNSPPTSYAGSDIGTDARPALVAEALPWYWLTSLCLNVLSPETSLFDLGHPPAPGAQLAPRDGREGWRERLRGMDLRGMLSAARSFSRSQEGIAMLNKTSTGAPLQAV